MCAICNKQPAVVFVSKSDGKQIINDWLYADGKWYYADEGDAYYSGIYEINGKEYVITPENVGFQDGRINCYIWVDGKEYEISNINKPWAERNFYYGKRHYGLEKAYSLFSAIALLNLPQTELELIVKAALDKCPNATEDFRHMDLNAF